VAQWISLTVWQNLVTMDNQAWKHSNVHQAHTPMLLE